MLIVQWYWCRGHDFIAPVMFSVCWATYVVTSRCWPLRGDPSIHCGEHLRACPDSGDLPVCDCRRCWATGTSPWWFDLDCPFVVTVGIPVVGCGVTLVRCYLRPAVFDAVVPRAIRWIRCAWSGDYSTATFPYADSPCGIPRSVLTGLLVFSGACCFFFFSVYDDLRYCRLSIWCWTIRSRGVCWHCACWTVAIRCPVRWLSVVTALLIRCPCWFVTLHLHSVLLFLRFVRSIPFIRAGFVRLQLPLAISVGWRFDTAAGTIGIYSVLLFPQTLTCSLVMLLLIPVFSVGPYSAMLFPLIPCIVDILLMPGTVVDLRFSTVLIRLFSVFFPGDIPVFLSRGDAFCCPVTRPVTCGGWYVTLRYWVPHVVTVLHSLIIVLFTCFLILVTMRYYPVFCVILMRGDWLFDSNMCSCSRGDVIGNSMMLFNCFPYSLFADVCSGGQSGVYHSSLGDVPIPVTLPSIPAIIVHCIAVVICWSRCWFRWCWCDLWWCVILLTVIRDGIYSDSVVDCWWLCYWWYLLHLFIRHCCWWYSDSVLLLFIGDCSF